MHAAAVQIPIGLEEHHDGVVDIIRRQAVYFRGEKGTTLIKEDVPDKLVAECEERRRELIEKLADVDDAIAEHFIGETDPSIEDLIAAIRRQTVARKFVPVFMGSAYKNKGVQLLLDGVNDYLPSPLDVENVALDLNNKEKPIALSSDPDKPFLALAFKLEESKYGQLTYWRVYQGRVEKGMTVLNITTGRKVKIPRIVRMHSNEMEDISSATVQSSLNLLLHN